ncbi:hypothetical protein Godav_006145 [Gossypium davidsonii]|uniref:HAT C-terminal dimerisation domain-containing protein n=1 Tax=Gossypium davidsonii TaxID=34287 RepID=A0A7J8S2Z4_GOSDV|nr:hypothetical protein [Gossypium davidsonii]
MVSCLENYFRANRARLCDGAFFQVRCCAHVLNLIVKIDLELVDDVVDMCVRWNSTYLMLESYLYYKDVLDYWGHWDKDYKIFALSDEEWRNIVILCKILKVFYDNSKFTYSSLAGSSNVSGNDPVDFSLHQLNINRSDLGGDYDESDGYKRYLSVSNTKSEKSQLDLYLKEPELELIPILTVAFELTFSLGKKVITLLGSSLKQKKKFKPLLALMTRCELRDFFTEIDCENDDDDEDDDSSIAF